MAFTIRLGTNNDNVLTVGKTFTTELSPTGGISISPTSKINLLKPVFVISYDAAYVNCNYVIASFLGRQYYCIPDVEIGKQIILNCTVDYLSSFDLSGCPITVLRNGGIGAPTKIQDNKFPIIPNEETIDQIPIANSHLTANGSGCYVLQVIGGAASVD